jgi:hypothetical protein
MGKGCGFSALRLRWPTKSFCEASSIRCHWVRVVPFYPARFLLSGFRDNLIRRRALLNQIRSSLIFLYPLDLESNIQLVHDGFLALELEGVK